jgi:hypothetical protein
MLHPQLQRGIQISEKFLCFITEKYDQSDNCFLELSWAKTLKKTIIVVMLENIDLKKLEKIGMIINPNLRISFSEHNYQNKILRAITDDATSAHIKIPPESLTSLNKEKTIIIADSEQVYFLNGI